jgi:glucose/mannose-6-phosphate isomerase
MKESILKFTEQFEFLPEIQNLENLRPDYQNHILGGMGGSSLCGNLFHIFRPGINLYIHRDYGLPPFDDEMMSSSLFIASSYSGNTEETLDFAEASFLKGYSVAVITTGGKLLEFAKKNKLPYILVPDTGIQPRMALGYFALAISAFVNPEMIPEFQSLIESIDVESIEGQGIEIAKQLDGKIPVIYSSSLNQPLGYVWKVIMNETGKTPAFQNYFPELNHNEIQSYDNQNMNEKMPMDFAFIILHDSEDHPQNELRMRVTEDLYQKNGFDVISLYLEGDSPAEKIFRSIILSNWIALKIAESNNNNPETVPMIEEFKKLVKESK